MNDLNGDQGPVVSQGEEQVSVLTNDPVLSSEPLQGGDDFRNYLADDIRSHPALANFKNFNDMAKSYLNSQSVIGRRFDDLTPEQLDMFYNKLGRPEAPDGYEIPGASTDDPMVSWYKETAHKLGLTQKAASEMFKSFGSLVQDHQAKEITRQQEVSDNYIKQMKQEYGASFDERIQCAQRALQEFGSPELRQLLSNPLIGNNPAVIQAFSDVGRRLLEHSGVRGQSVPFKLSPEEAANEIKNLNRDPEFLKAYLDHRHPSHNEAVERHRGLYNIAYNGDPL